MNVIYKPLPSTRESQQHLKQDLDIFTTVHIIFNYVYLKLIYQQIFYSGI